VLFEANRYTRGGRRRVAPARLAPAGSCNTGGMETWSPAQLVIALVVASALSMATFAHADRHGSEHATAWGVGAFLLAAVVVPVYFMRYWLIARRSR
jgi:hypothetical protein